VEEELMAQDQDYLESRIALIERNYKTHLTETQGIGSKPGRPKTKAN